MALTLRKWQQQAVNRSLLNLPGIFLEAAGGRGKTLCALEIARARNAQSILIVNKKLSILDGWKESLQHYSFADVTCITDKTLKNRLAKGEKFDVDIFIIDEWQDMCSDKNLEAYKRVKRKYTIGLSATPIRRKGTNFFGLEQTVFGQANPSKKWEWMTYWGQMVADQWTQTGLKWLDFRDYENYIAQLPNFMSYEEIEAIENAVENNGHELRFHRVLLEDANPELIRMFNKYNLVRVNGQSAMARQSFGRNSFMRYLRQTGVEVEFPKLRAVNVDTPTLLYVDKMIATAPGGLLIVTKSVQIAEIIKERNPQIAFWSGDRRDDSGERIMVATQQVMGVGVDGLQSRFNAILVLDPVLPSSGEYNDYRQLLWRVTGSRQQHDVVVIETYFEGDVPDEVV